MKSDIITEGLKRNQKVFNNMLSGLGEEVTKWKTSPDKRSLLEITCYLYAKERYDFKIRLRHILETPKSPIPIIEMPDWMRDGHSEEQDFDEMLNKFIGERANSVRWLKSLHDPSWDQVYKHPSLGRVSGNNMLSNWLDHDYLHIREILVIKQTYLKTLSGNVLRYA